MKKVSFFLLACMICICGFSQGKLQTVKDNMEYDEIWKASDGLLRFKKGGKSGYMNKSGTEVIPAQFEPEILLLSQDVIS